MPIVLDLAPRAEDVDQVHAGLIAYNVAAIGPATLCGLGYGSALLAEAEVAGREAGCIVARLDTYEFQARPFYERFGYMVYGELDGYPGGTRTYLMRKFAHIELDEDA